MLAVFVLFAFLVAGLGYTLFLSRRWLDSILSMLHSLRDPWRYPPRYEPLLYDIIDRAEREAGIRLTPLAREMLTLPIIEQLVDGRSIDLDQVAESVRSIFATLRDDSIAADRATGGARNTLGVIRSFFRNFCNIPPFCSRTEESSPRRPT